MTATDVPITWDYTDPNNPQPRLWPECPSCEEPYQYVHGINMLTGNVVWSWRCFCKCRPRRMPVVHQARGDGDDDAD